MVVTNPITDFLSMANPITDPITDPVTDLG
jgi:hypothetical protein